MSIKTEEIIKTILLVCVVGLIVGYGLWCIGNVYTVPVLLLFGVIGVLTVIVGIIWGD
jgi:hypothetical protein